MIDHDNPQRRETDWLFQRLNSLEDQMRDQHQRLRSDMNAGFAKLSHEVGERVQPLERRAEDHSGRIIVIETERRAEAAAAVKKGALAGILAASGLQAAMKVLEHWWK